MRKKRIVEKYLVLFLLVSCFLWVATSSAQDYPKGTIQLVVPFAPGGATDIFWRTLGDYLSKNLKANLAIVNKPGGGGIVGMSSVVNSKPDGYTLCAGNSDTLNITPLFTKDLPFDTINDLTYIVKFTIFPQTIAVRAESPFKTLEDVVAFAKANPKKLKSCTPGVGTSPYMALHVFNHDAKVELVPVAFGGGGETVPSILGGHVDLGFIAMPPIKSQFVAGKIRVLAFLSKNRHPLYPDIPTAFEKGFKQTVIETGIGLVGPKGLPLAVIKKWEEVAQTTLKDPNVISAIQKFDYVVDFKRGEEYKKEIADELVMFKKLLPKSVEQK
jgi:tripartite-type tricarboxylate transporter receptor subunit TctC